MILPLRLFLSSLIGFALAFAFNITFLDVLDRPFLDQILLTFFSAVASVFLIFIWIGSGNEIWGSLKNIRTRKINWSRVVFISFLREHAPGMMLALFFLIVYLYLGLRFNNPNIDTVDNYFDADNSSWMRRIGMPDGHQMEMRGPHPFAYFVFRPLGWILNLLTGNPALTAILLNTLAGGLCVFLAWVFIKNQSRDRVYAFLFAALLGISTSHLVFGSIVESYIFSAAALIGFFLLLQTRRVSTGSLVAMSLLTFGITITNFVQNFVGFVISRPRWKDLFRFVGLVLSLGVFLSLLHAAWYPSSKLFFLPSDAQGEEEFTISILRDPAWRVVGRVMLLIRTILLYSVVAPPPFVFTREVGGTFPRFNFFKISPEDFQLSSYSGLGNVLVAAWAALMLIAGILFLRDLIHTRKTDISLAFVLCLLFNFLLHLFYGYEPFLYSPDWTYALVFFVALGLAPLAKYRWFQAGLFVFLILLAYNQWQFIDFIFDTVSPFISQGG